MKCEISCSMKCMKHLIFCVRTTVYVIRNVKFPLIVDIVNVSDISVNKYPVHFLHILKKEMSLFVAKLTGTIIFLHLYIY